MNLELPPSPAFALVRRELLVLARNPRLFGLMAGMTTVLALAALFSLSFISVHHGQMAEFARSIFGKQFFLLYAAALIVVPAMAAAAIVHERKQDCYPLLLTTLIPPRWIVWSKLVALLGLYAGFYAGVLPFTGIIYFFAGVEPLALLQGALVSFSLALGTASIGLLSSTSAKDHSQALYHTALGVLCMVFLPWTARVVLDVLGLPRIGWLQSIGPLKAYVLVSSGLPDWRPPLAFALYQGCVACFCLALARRQILPREHVTPIGLMARLARRVSSRRPLPFTPCQDGMNPITSKDLRSSVFSRGAGPWLLGMAGLIAGGVAYFLPRLNSLSGTPLVEFYILLIVVPPIAVSVVLAEREQGMIESLLVTLLNGEDIARGKVACVVKIIAPFVAGAIVGRVATYGMSIPQSNSGNSDPLATIWLVAGCLELILYLFVLPRIALFDPVLRTNALTATFGSYASVVLASIMVFMLSFTFAGVVMGNVMDATMGTAMRAVGTQLLSLTITITNCIFFLLAGRISMQNSTNNYNHIIRAYDLWNRNLD